MLVFVGHGDAATKQPLHLIAEPGVLSAAGAVNTERSHEVCQRFSQDQLAVLGPHRFGADPSEDQARQVSEGEFVATRHRYVEGKWPVGALVLKPVAGVAPGQRAQRHRSRHETPVGVRFAGPDQLVHLIGKGEVVVGPRRGFTDHFHRVV